MADDNKDLIVEMHSIMMEVRQRLHLLIRVGPEYTAINRRMDAMLDKLRDKKLIG